MISGELITLIIITGLHINSHISDSGDCRAQCDQHMIFYLFMKVHETLLFMTELVMR